MQKNPGLDQNQKSSLITFIKTQGQEFVDSYLQNNTAVPYNTQSVAQSLIQTLDSAVQQRNDAGTYVNEEEKEEIISKASDLFLLAIRGNSDATVYEIYPNFESDSNYLAAVELYKGLGTSVHPKEDLAKMKELLTTMLQNRGIDNIINGVKTQEKKNVDISPSDINDNLWGYNSKDTFDNDDIIALSFKITDGKIEYTNSKDVDDIEKTMTQLLEKLKTILKDQLGDMYDEEMVEAVFERAQIDAVSQLTNGNGYSTKKFRVAEFVDRIVGVFNDYMTNALHDKNSYSSVEPNYGDSSLTNGLEGFEEHHVISTSLGYDSNGDIYLKDDSDNKIYQTTMDELYDRLVEKYKAELGDNFDGTYFETCFEFAKQEALEQYSKRNVTMKTLIDVTLMKLDLVLLRLK